VLPCLEDNEAPPLEAYQPKPAHGELVNTAIGGNPPTQGAQSRPLVCLGDQNSPAAPPQPELVESGADKTRQPRFPQQNQIAGRIGATASPPTSPSEPIGTAINGTPPSQAAQSQPPVCYDDTKRPASDLQQESLDSVVDKTQPPGPPRRKQVDGLIGKPVLPATSPSVPVEITADETPLPPVAGTDILPTEATVKDAGSPGDKSSNAQQGSDPTEMRIDPHDGRAYTYVSLASYYQNQYSPDEVKAYWDQACRPVGAAGAGAKKRRSKAKRGR